MLVPLLSQAMLTVLRLHARAKHGSREHDMCRGRVCWFPRCSDHSQSFHRDRLQVLDIDPSTAYEKVRKKDRTRQNEIKTSRSVYSATPMVVGRIEKKPNMSIQVTLLNGTYSKYAEKVNDQL